MPNQEQKLIGEVQRQAAEIGVLGDLIAGLLAEIALADQNPIGRLKQLQASEAGAVYAATSQTDEVSPALQKVWADKQRERARVIDLSDQILRRVLDTRTDD